MSYFENAYVVDKFQLLSRDERAVVEGEREFRGQSGHVAQPQFEKSHLYQNQLIVLTEVHETYHCCGTHGKGELRL